jgi:hypothetical protein
MLVWSRSPTDTAPGSDAYRLMPNRRRPTSRADPANPPIRHGTGKTPVRGPWHSYADIISAIDLTLARAK